MAVLSCCVQTVEQKMASWLLANVFSVRKVGILMQVTELLDMGLHPEIKELKIGGPFSEEEALHGGLTFSTKWLTLNYLI